LISTVRENPGHVNGQKCKKGLKLKEKTICYECKRHILRSILKGLGLEMNIFWTSTMLNQYLQYFLNKHCWLFSVEIF